MRAVTDGDDERPDPARRSIDLGSRNIRQTSDAGPIGDIWRIHDTWRGDGLGLAAFATALGIRYAVDDVLPPGFPFLTFFPAVIVTTYFCGLRPGVTCATLSGFAAWYFFIPPKNRFGLDAQVALALVFYVFIVAVDIALIRAAYRAGRRLKAERAVTAGLYDRQRVLFQELQHRVANNMQFVGALLTLQKRRVRHEPAVALQAVEEAEERLATFARLHRRLYDPDLVDAPIGDTLHALCAELVEASGTSNVAIYIDAAPVRLGLDRLTTLSLLVTEIVTNALKHGFPQGRSGAIDVRLSELSAGLLCLRIRDDGQGLPEGFDPKSRRGLGFRIVQNLVDQLQGQMSVEGVAGTVVEVEFAAE